MSNKIDLVWTGATDDKGISGYELSYTLGPDFSENTKVVLPIIPSSSGSGNYSHTITNYVDHKFAIRTIDTSGQYSSYKYLIVNVNPADLISDVGDSMYSSLICTSPIYEPKNIIVVGNMVVGGIIYNSDGVTPYNGNGYVWRVLYRGASYAVKINTSGVIQSINSCGLSNVKTCTVSRSYSDYPNLCLNSDSSPTTILYYSGNMAVGTILYTSDSLTQPFDGLDKLYKMVTDTKSVVKIGTGADIGKVLMYEPFNLVCGITSYVDVDVDLRMYLDPVIQTSCRVDKIFLDSGYVFNESKSNFLITSNVNSGNGVRKFTVFSSSSIGLSMLNNLPGSNWSPEHVYKLKLFFEKPGSPNKILDYTGDVMFTSVNFTKTTKVRIWTTNGDIDVGGF